MFPVPLAAFAASPAAGGLGLVFVLALLVLSARAFATSLAGAPAAPMDTASRMGELSLKALRELGIEPQPGFRYRKHRMFDTKTLAITDGGTVQFFNNATTSSRSGHAKKAAGCSLLEPGIVDRNTENHLLALYVKLVDVNGTAVATTLTDVAKLLDSGILDNLTINGVALFENLKLDEMGRNLGYTPTLSGAAAALQIDGVTIGQPGFADLGYVLDPFERSTVIGGQRISAQISRTSGGALAALTPALEFGIVCIRGEPRTSN